MKNTLLLISLLTFTFQLNAQNFDVPPNPKAGKCYQRCFNYDKKFTWKEIDCPKPSKQKTKKTNEELLKCEQEKIKMGKYQEKLKALGYDVDITKIADNKTIITHHKNLKNKKKEGRRKKKRLKNKKS